MFGRISIVYDQRYNVLQVPRSAILEESGDTSVFVVEDDKAMRREVVTGYSNAGMIEVIEGLEDGDRVVTVGQIGLKDEALVTVINQSEETPEAEATQVSNDAPTD
jgi:membrane fusion protein (multidrug efflux system)